MPRKGKFAKAVMGTTTGLGALAVGSTVSALPVALIAPELMPILGEVALASGTSFAALSGLLTDDLDSIPRRIKEGIRKLPEREKETLIRGIGKIKGKLHERRLRRVI